MKLGFCPLTSATEASGLRREAAGRSAPGGAHTGRLVEGSVGPPCDNGEGGPQLFLFVIINGFYLNQMDNKTAVVKRGGISPASSVLEFERFYENDVFADG